MKPDNSGSIPGSGSLPGQPGILPTNPLRQRCSTRIDEVMSGVARIPWKDEMKNEV